MNGPEHESKRARYRAIASRLFPAGRVTLTSPVHEMTDGAFVEAQVFIPDVALMSDVVMETARVVNERDAAELRNVIIGVGGPKWAAVSLGEQSIAAVVWGATQDEADLRARRIAQQWNDANKNVSHVISQD